MKTFIIRFKAHVLGAIDIPPEQFTEKVTAEAEMFAIISLYHKYEGLFEVKVEEVESKGE